MKNIGEDPAVEYLRIIKSDFVKYRKLAEGAFNQLEEKDFFNTQGGESNSAAVIIRHLSGNMISRFTDFLTADGEKPDRNRDSEFEEPELGKEGLIGLWNKGWEVMSAALDSLTPEDLTKKVKIRNESHSVMEALNRQATHYAYHIGQIIYIAKGIKKSAWNSLSIPKGRTEEFNREMFARKD